MLVLNLRFFWGLLRTATTIGDDYPYSFRTLYATIHPSPGNMIAVVEVDRERENFSASKPYKPWQ